VKPRVAYVSTIVAGGESAVRAAHDFFPRAALTNSGASSVSVFIGSGYYVLVLEHLTDDFQDQFARFTGDPEVRRFFEQLKPYLEEPLPVSVRPADDFHEAEPTDGRTTPTTARLPLVGEVFHWEMTAH
jgi:hypothetical protein